MKIKLTEDFYHLKKDSIFNAVVDDKKTRAYFFDASGEGWLIMHRHQFEIVEEENQEIIDRVEKAKENIDEIPKVYGNKYTLGELKELKELFRC